MRSGAHPLIANVGRSNTEHFRQRAPAPVERMTSAPNEYCTTSRRAADKPILMSGPYLSTDRHSPYPCIRRQSRDGGELRLAEPSHRTPTHRCPNTTGATASIIERQFGEPNNADAGTEPQKGLERKRAPPSGDRLTGSGAARHCAGAAIVVVRVVAALQGRADPAPPGPSHYRTSQPIVRCASPPSTPKPRARSRSSGPAQGGGHAERRLFRGCGCSDLGAKRPAWEENPPRGGRNNQALSRWACSGRAPCKRPVVLSGGAARAVACSWWFISACRSMWAVACVRGRVRR
jgi:hypothetical protein